jgi:hypothetical protein
MKKRKNKFPPKGFIGIEIFLPPKIHKALNQEIYESRQSGHEKNKAERVAEYFNIGYHNEKQREG